MAMDATQTQGSSQELVITFELVTEEGENDPALINVLGHDTVVGLQQEEYIARPPSYTDQKGGESFLVEFVTIVQQMAMVAWTNHTAIAESITDISGLVTIFGSILPMLKRMRQAHETHKKQVGREKSVVCPIRMIVEID